MSRVGLVFPRPFGHTLGLPGRQERPYGHLVWEAVARAFSGLRVTGAGGDELQRIRDRWLAACDARFWWGSVRGELYKY